MGFPKNTDPKKTYMWRYLNYFINKVDEWEISDSTSYKLIDAIIAQSKRNNQLHKKGLAILSSDKILETGYKAINAELKLEGDTLDRLREDHIMLSAYSDKVHILMERPSTGALPNIVQWYIQGRLSRLYLATSKSCSTAMNRLSEFELTMLPNNKELLLLKHSCFKNALTKHRAKSILGDEWKNGF